ncbi:MAG TPA: hypothetical protein VGT05_03630 [Patescibacteria group bacterium]|nr:hypothetical protein [Patescibacteria group bacterium]
MDFERGGIEFQKSVTQEVRDESGYSENQQAKDVEQKGVDFKNMQNRKQSQPVFRQSKILGAYKKISSRIEQLLVVVTTTVLPNSRQHDAILDEIKTLRNVQEELIQCLLLDQKGALRRETTSKETWNLIE